MIYGNPKPERIMDRVRRHMKRRDTKAAEERVMRQVRREDRYCRFPLCGCGKLKLPLDVAHAGDEGHRGMGGNPSLSATTPENLILLCRPRHRAHKFAIDKKTLRVEPLTARGLRGPVRWLIDPEATQVNELLVWRGDRLWFPLAMESRPHVVMPLSAPQSAILHLLAGMEC